MLIIGIYIGSSLVEFVIYIFPDTWPTFSQTNSFSHKKTYNQNGLFIKCFYGRPFSIFRPLILKMLSVKVLNVYVLSYL